MSTIKSLAVLLFVLVAGMITHRLILGWQHQGITWPEYVFGYGVNLLMAGIIIIALFNLPQRFKDSLGYFFLFGSLFKFIIYFLVFQPVFRDDGEVTRLEFFSFFVPYALSLVVETSVLIIKLKQEEETQ